MKKYKFKPTGIVGTLKFDKLIHFNTTKEHKEFTIPEEFVKNSNDWEKLKDDTKSNFKISSVVRETDGKKFSIGEHIQIKGGTFIHTISGFVIENYNNNSFICCSTKHKNNFDKGLINLDIIDKLLEEDNINKKCLSIQDYIDVLHENKKAFLFEKTMIKFLKKKLQ